MLPSQRGTDCFVKFTSPLALAADLLSQKPSQKAIKYQISSKKTGKQAFNQPGLA